MMTAINQFNIRVYALILNQHEEILLTDEKRYGMLMTKFPGGGLIPGEGIIDCLQREAKEELGQQIEIERHFYTTDFFQKALFHENQQLISVYYLASIPGKEMFRLSEKAYDFTDDDTEPLSFRYVSLKKLTPEQLSFPVDRHVLKLLKQEFGGDH